MPDGWIQVATTDALSPGSTLRVEAQGMDLALHNVDGRFYCTSNVCPHQGQALHTGRLEGAHLTCPWHAWVFNVTTGIGPYNEWARIPCFPVRVEGGVVYVNLSQNSQAGL